MAMLKVTIKILCNFRSIKAINLQSISILNLSTISSNLPSITSDIISIFTKNQFCPDSPALKSLAPFLNTKVVESALNSFKSWKLAHTFFNWASNQCGYKHNIYTYNAMASILSRARQNALLRALSIDILNSRCSMTPGSLGFLIRCFGSVGLLEEANLLFDKVKIMGLCVPDIYSYNCLLDAISSSNSTYVGLLETRLKEMRDQGWEFNKYTLTPVLQFYCNQGKFDKALGVFHEILNRGWADECIFSILVVSFSKWGEVDKAIELIEKMEGQYIRLNEKTFFVLIHGFVKQSRVDKALQLFDMMKNYGYIPDISLYDVLIGGLCTDKKLEEALSLFSEMKRYRILPDSRIVTKLISSFPEEGELTQIVEEVKKDMNVDLTFICNSVLNSLVANGFIYEALNLLQAMMGSKYNSSVLLYKLFQHNERVPPDTTSFTVVINGLLQACKLDLAFPLFRDMAQFGCNRDLLLYNNLINGLCDSDRLEESYELLREMEESGNEPTQFTLNSIFGCLCRQEDVSGALDLIKKMRVHGHEPWVKHYTLLVRKMCEHGKAIEAYGFLGDMVKEGFLPDIVAYSTLLDGLIKIQEIDKALKLFRDICACGHCPDVIAYNILLKGLCRSKRIAEAQNLFNELLNRGLVPSVVTYNLLIDGCCKNGLIDEALVCVSSMSAKKMKANVITYTALIDGLCKNGRCDDAVRVWNEMEKEECIPNIVAFTAMIHGLCKCGRPHAALVHLRDMEEKEMEADTCVYTNLISAFVANLDLPMAFEILKEMVDKEKFPNLVDKNCIILREAILKLLEDVRTSANVKSLIANGRIPTICISANGSEDV